MAVDSSLRFKLFFASCVSLIATAMVFAVRGDIIGDLEGHFTLSPTSLGFVMLLAFWGFTLSIVIGGSMCDALGVKNIMVLAFIFHAAGILLTIFAPGWQVLALATLIIGMGNGFVEAGINPLAATLYPTQKTKMLNILHAWWPGGIVIGSLVAYIMGLNDATWQSKMWVIMVPVIIYGALILPLRFPATERVQSGVSTSEMFMQLFKPLFLLLLFCMCLSAATELGTNQWVGEIMKNSGIKSGILILAWISIIMVVGRLFAGHIVERFSPVGLLIGSAAVSALGLILLGMVNSTITAFGASFVFAVGICYFWPTMLGIAAERFPKGGAFTLGLMGAAGMAAAGLSQPLLGNLYERFGPGQALQTMAFFPVLLMIIFIGFFIYDRSRGGYKIERLDTQEVVETGGTRYKKTIA